MQYKNIFAMIFNEIKCHVNTSLGLLGGDASLPFVRAWTSVASFAHYASRVTAANASEVLEPYIIKRQIGNWMKCKVVTRKKCKVQVICCAPETHHLFSLRDHFCLLYKQWRGQHKSFGDKIFNFRRATVFCLGYRLSTRKMTAPLLRLCVQNFIIKMMV